MFRLVETILEEVNVGLACRTSFRRRRRGQVSVPHMFNRIRRLVECAVPAGCFSFQLRDGCIVGSSRHCCWSFQRIEACICGE